MEIENNNEQSLSWYEISRSRDGLYETPKEIANFIYNILHKGLTPGKSLIFDPTAGGGRLLKPFYKNNHIVYGVEFKEDVYNRLKHNIKKKYSNHSNIEDFYHANKYSMQPSVFVSNPPFGLRFSNDNYDFGYADKDIESQTAIVKMASQMLNVNGILALIIPTSTWTNSKDRQLASHLNQKFCIYAKITIKNAFKKEYGITKETDLVIAKRKADYYSGYTCPQEASRKEIHTIDIKELSSFAEEFTMCDKLFESNFGYYKNKEAFDEEASNMVSYCELTSFASPTPESTKKLYLKNNGFSGNYISEALIEFYNKTNISAYSPLYGREIDIKECYFSLPAIINDGIEFAKNEIEKIGFDVCIDDNSVRKFNKLKERWDFLKTPIHKPKSHELLAYYQYQKYEAIKDFFDKDGKQLYKKGGHYTIKPMWYRTTEAIKEEEILDKKGNSTGEKQITSIDTGYLRLQVDSENGMIEYAENDTDKIAEFLEIFELPDVKGISELYPKRVEAWANYIAKNFPSMSGEYIWQAEELSRVLCKPLGYIGLEMGGGKCNMSMAYATARQYQRVLVICQGSLVENWQNEADKFGFKATAIKSHKDIAKLRDRVRKKDFARHETEFFIIGQEFLSLDGGRTYDTWTVTEYDEDGEVIFKKTSNKGKIKNIKFENHHTHCPKCEANYNNGWSGRYCRNCGHKSFTYGKYDSETTGMRQYPAYKHLKKLFSCVITDESQNFAARSLRGEASRAIKTKSRLLLTGTIMKNYIKDVFINFGWVLGYNNPVYYFGRDDIKKFLEEFGSYEIITTEYLNEMKNASYRNRNNGRKKMLPEVSNINRFWKLISPFTIRKRSNDIKQLKEIPRERNVEILGLEPDHATIYESYHDWAKKKLNFELSKEKINMGVISDCLWKLRYVASCPANPKLIKKGCSDSEYPNINLQKPSWNKIKFIEKYINENIINKDEKLIIFSGHRFMQSYIYKRLIGLGYKVRLINSSVKTSKRFDEIKDFEDNYDVLVTGNSVLNRGYTIIGANHVICIDPEYTPETLDQAEFRVIRPGQDKKVFITHLISSGTIDEEILNIADLKRKAINSAIDKNKAEYADIRELLEQADYRNPELAIAKKINEKHKLNIKIEKTIVKEENVAIPIFEEEEDDYLEDFFEDLLSDIKQEEEVKEIKKSSFLNKKVDTESDQWFIQFG